MVKKHLLQTCFFILFVIPSHTQVIGQQSNLAKAYEWIGKGENLSQAAQLLSTVEDLEGDSLALAYHKLGVAYYIIDDFESAIQNLEIALNRRKTYLVKNDTNIIRGYHSIGDCYHLLGELNKALPYLETALRLNRSRQTPFMKYLTLTYRVLGNVHFKRGDLDLGKSYLATATQLYTEYYADEPWNLAAIYQDFSALYINQEEADSILAYAKKGLELYSALDPKYPEDSLGMADCYHNLGTGYELKDELEAAMKHYQLSLAINQQYAAVRQEAIANNFFNLSLVYQKKKEYDLGIEYINKALSIYEALASPYQIAQSFHNRGIVKAMKGSLDEALADQQAAIRFLALDFEGASPFENPAVDGGILVHQPLLIRFLHEKAKVFVQKAQLGEAQKHLSAALATYDTLSKVMDLLRYSFQQDGSKAWLAGRAKLIFEGAISAALQLYSRTNKEEYLNKAFGYAERSRAVILLEAVARNQFRQEQELRDTSVRAELDLQRQIARIERQIFEGTYSRKFNADSILKLRTQLLATQQELESLRSNWKQNPLQSSDQVATVAQLQAYLSAQSCMLSYFTGQDNIYLFLVDKEKLIVRTIPLDFDLKDWVGKLREGIVAPFTNDHLNTAAREELYQQYADYAWRLYSKLIPDDLHTQLGAEMIIIPDGLLGFVPFDALLKNEPAASFQGFDQYDFLIEDHIISYSYSASILAKTKEQHRREGRKFSVFAPEYDLAGIALGRDSIRFAALPYAARSASAISELMGASLFAGGEASKEQFNAISPSSTYLHIAAHAEVNDAFPDYSFIAFSNTDASTSSLLFLNEVYHLGLQAELVTISACKTSLGRLAEGEGILSLSRAFAYAGARSVITTLWEVNDQKSARLMTDFYSFLAEGQRKDEALRNAKLQLIDEAAYAAPYYWAGFVAYGQMDTISGSSFFMEYWPYLLIVGLLLVALAFLYLKTKPAPKAV